MSYNQAIADKILEYVDNTSNTDALHLSELFETSQLSETDEIDFQDTARELISSGKINAKLKNDYQSIYLDFRIV